MGGYVSGIDTGYRCYSGKVFRRKLTWESIPVLLVMNRSDTGNEGLSVYDIISPLGLLMPIPVTAMLGYRYFSGVPSKSTGFLPTDSSSRRQCLNRNFSSWFMRFLFLSAVLMKIAMWLLHQREPEGLSWNSSSLIIKTISFKLILLNTDLFVLRSEWP